MLHSCHWPAGRRIVPAVHYTCSLVCCIPCIHSAPGLRNARVASAPHGRLRTLHSPRLPSTTNELARAPLRSLLTLPGASRLGYSQFDLTTFTGRLQHYARTTNPLNSLASTRDLEQAKALVEAFE